MTELTSTRPINSSNFIDLFTGIVMGFASILFTVFLFRYNFKIHIDFNKK